MQILFFLPSSCILTAEVVDFLYAVKLFPKLLIDIEVLSKEKFIHKTASRQDWQFEIVFTKMWDN